MSVTQSIFYPLGGDDVPVRLRVTVGEGQKGATVVRVGGRLVTTSEQDVVDAALGPGEDLRGEKVFCTTVVTDVNPESDVTSICWELTGGFEPLTRTCTSSLDRTGDSVLYVAVIYCL